VKEAPACGDCDHWGAAAIGLKNVQVTSLAAEHHAITCTVVILIGFCDENLKNAGRGAAAPHVPK
jgi:hypothetical protein